MKDFVLKIKKLITKLKELMYAGSLAVIEKIKSADVQVSTADEIRKYKQLISNEPYDSIVIEMLSDLKDLLLKTSKDIDINYAIIETFYDIKNSENVIDDLSVL